MLVCPPDRLKAPQTIELPGKDRKDLAVKTLWSQGFCGLRHGGPRQTMLSDRFPGGEKKEEEANNEKEKAAVSNQMFFQGSSYEDR